MHAESLAIPRKSYVHFAPAPPPPVMRRPRDRGDAAKFRQRQSMQEAGVSPHERQFLRNLLDAAGLNPGAYRIRPLHRRLRACLRALGAETIADARRRLMASPELLNRALETLLIGTTGFFRDRLVFETLEHDVLPSVVSVPSPHVWSAGCSDGSELYSIAILLNRMKTLDRAVLLGTDCRASAMRSARAGIFRFHRRPPGVARYWEQFPEYFHLTAAGARVDPKLQARIEWRRADLLCCNDREQWDLILCRNLLIYLDAEAAAGACTRLRNALKPGGYLVLGPAERPPAELGLVRIASCVYRRERILPCG